jgi:hypothetical protein
VKSPPRGHATMNTKQSPAISAVSHAAASASASCGPSEGTSSTFLLRISVVSSFDGTPRPSVPANNARCSWARFLFFGLIAFAAAAVCAGEPKPPAINADLWYACAGPLVSLPPAGSLVVYFPQGHSEQVRAAPSSCSLPAASCKRSFKN